MKTIGINDETKRELDAVCEELKASIPTTKVSYDTAIRHLLKRYRGDKPCSMSDSNVS
jgi:hypothetical protein